MDYSEAFQMVLEEARKVSEISDAERDEFYEPLKTIVYDLIESGEDIKIVVSQAVSWLRQNVQIRQSLKRVDK